MTEDISTFTGSSVNIMLSDDGIADDVTVSCVDPEKSEIVCSVQFEIPNGRNFDKIDLMHTYYDLGATLSNKCSVHALAIRD